VSPTPKGDLTKGEQTRQEIVERALALAGEVGLEGLSLGVLAAGMNLSKSGLFAHFRSKEALQVEVLQRAIDHFIADVVAPALRQPRGEPRLRRLFDLYLVWVHGNGGRGSCFFMALTHEYDDRPGPVRDLLVQRRPRRRPVLLRVRRHRHGLPAGRQAARGLPRRGARPRRLRDPARPQPFLTLPSGKEIPCNP
jgi:AcrR family transcriptional regulator